MWLYLALTTQLLYGGGILPVAKSQLSPTDSRLIFHTLPSERVSRFGSQVDGRCNSTSVMNDVNICNGTSVLNNGVTPTLYGVSEDPSSEWARQLFTMRRNGTDTISLTFQLASGVNRDRVEVTVFNCPQRGIYVPFVHVYVNFQLLPQTRSLITRKPLQNTSCNHLIKFCLDFGLSTTSRFFTLEFPHQIDSDFVFLGEVTFYDGGSSSCDAPELIDATTYPLPPITSSRQSNESTTTRDATSTQGLTPTPGQGLPTTIIIVVVILLLVATADVFITMIMLMVFIRRRKRRRNHNQVQQLQNVATGSKEEEVETELTENICYSSVGSPQLQSVAIGTEEVETKLTKNVCYGSVGSAARERKKGEVEAEITKNICYGSVGSPRWNKHNNSNDIDLLNGVYSVPDDVKSDTHNRLRGDEQYPMLKLAEASLLASNASERLPPVPPHSSPPLDVDDMYTYIEPNTKKCAQTSKKQSTTAEEEVLESMPEYSEIVM